MGLSDKRVVTAIAVTDMAAAREFYEGGLGLSPNEERTDGGVRYPCGGDTALHVYPSLDNAGTSTATLAGFQVDDIERAVDELAAKGIVFERYDSGPIATDEKGIARIGVTASAWFKDPDGNTLALVQG